MGDVKATIIDLIPEGNKLSATALDYSPYRELVKVMQRQQDQIDALLARDTIPAPSGDSHSGAIVVPRGSSNPPPPVTDLSQVCQKCDMFACVCGIPHAGRYP